MLKSLLKVGFIAVIAIFLNACGGNEPSDLAIKVTKLIYDGKGKEVVKYAPISEQEKEMLPMMEGKFQTMSEQSKQEAQKKGGIKDIKVVDENINGDKASVKVEITFKDGSTSSDNLRFVKIKDEWKLQL